MRPKLSFIIVILTVVSAIFAAAADVPPGIPGEVVYVPFPVETGSDGLPADWSSIPSYEVTSGPSTSGVAGENDSFSFALAADETTLFLRFVMNDRNIVAGKHAGDYWNEDSLEFYLNDTGDLEARGYGPGVVQVNVNATGLETGGLELSGNRQDEEGLDIRGRTFSVDGGWGFEAAVSMDGRTLPEHGAAFGFQAQANGATQMDRDVKLIWSVFDTKDQSYQSPALFGTAVYYELGRDDVPKPPSRGGPAAARTAVPPEKRSRVRINQHAYPRWGSRIAVAADESAEELEWVLLDAGGTEKARGTTVVYGPDIMSGENLHIVDFSDYEGAGAAMTLRVGDLESPPLHIAADPYADLASDALAYFYRSRAGIEVDRELGGAEWARGAWFSSDAEVRPFSGVDSTGAEWEEGDYVVNAGHGWFDAGDYGKYTVNGAIAAWTLGNLHERFPQAAGDGESAIPEAGNGIPDILDEIRWEMDFLLGMQVPRGEDLEGMVHHKLHELEWHPFPMMGVVTADDRFVYHPSTAATYDMAAAAAQFARLIKPYDRRYAGRCLEAAERAWKAAEENPVFLYGNIPGSGGGNYDDANVSDERFFAAAELFVTTGKGRYRRAAAEYLESPEWDALAGNLGASLSWQQVSFAGALSLASSRRPGFGVRKAAAEGILESAEAYLKVAMSDGYGVPLTEYPWGSNSAALNMGLVMVSAADLADEAVVGAIFRDAAAGILDYLLGRNALAQSYVTGYGVHDAFSPHHRFWAGDPGLGHPYPPPGVLVGGPNSSPSDGPGRTVADRAPAKRYIDDNGSYSTNEVAINWNAPLAWMAAWASSMAQGD